MPMLEARRGSPFMYAVVLGLVAAPISARSDATALSVTLPSGSVDRPSAPKARVDRWLEESDEERQAESGAIDPAYRIVERAVRYEFNPPEDAVKLSSWGGALRDQTEAFFADPSRMREEPMARFDRRAQGQEAELGDPPGLNLRSLPAAQQQAALDAWQQPVWLEAEVAIDVGAEGHVVAVRLLQTSGFRRFDRYARESLERSTRGRSWTLPQPARIVFRVRGAYVAKLTPCAGASLNSGALRDAPAGSVQREVQLLRVEPGAARR
jgi:TonB C terminal